MQKKPQKVSVHTHSCLLIAFCHCLSSTYINKSFTKTKKSPDIGVLALAYSMASPTSVLCHPIGSRGIVMVETLGTHATAQINYPKWNFCKIVLR